MPFNVGLDIGSVLSSLAGGLFGGSQQGEMTWQQQVLLKMMIKNLRAQQQYGNGVPGSDPQEQAALAQARAGSGNDLAQSREGLLASLGTENPNSADALGRFASAQSGQLAGIDSNAMLQFLQQRQGVKFGIAGQAAAGLGAATAARPQATGGFDFSQLISQLGRQQGYGNSGGGGALPAGYGAGLVGGLGGVLGGAFPPPPLTGTSTPNYGAQPWNDKTTWR